MANVCLYKIKVKGTQKACYALVNMMPLYSGEKEYISEEGTETDFTLVFQGDCKWAVDSYTQPMTNPVAFTEEELDQVQDGDHWGVTLKDKSILLNCEIFCNSKDIENPGYADYVHYDKGDVIYDECPTELHIKRGRDYDYGYDSSERNTCLVKFESGSYWYIGDYKPGDLVYVEGAKAGKLGRVVETKVQNGGDLYDIAQYVGHIDPFVSGDMENIWNGYAVQDRKEWLLKLDLPDNMTKQKFLSSMEWQWTLFAQKQNDWNTFLQLLREGIYSFL